MTTTLAELLTRLKTGEAVTIPAGETWAGMIARTTAPGRACEIDEETYDYFLEVLPPRWMGSGAGFAFGEGGDHLRLVWRSGGRLFCRQLTEAEHTEFCRLAGVGLSSG